MQPIKAVLFDMDGLLFDSERIGLDMMVEAGRKIGFTLSRDVIVSTLGISRAAGQQIYEKHYPGIDHDLLFDTFNEGMYALAAEGKMPLKKGAVELLKFLKEKNIPAAVVSSSHMPTIENYIRPAGVKEYFTAFLSGDMFTRSKPFPDPFLQAAEKLGVAPQNCMVLEDSVNGVKSGRAAGCLVCMVPDVIPYSKDLEPYVDHVLDSLEKVIPLLNV